MLFQVAEKFRVVDVDAFSWAVPFPLLMEWAAHFVLSDEEAKEQAAKTELTAQAEAGIDELRKNPII